VIAILQLTDYYLITGRRPPGGPEVRFDEDPLAQLHAEDTPGIRCPPERLGTLTYDREARRPRDLVNEVAVYADGWRLWIRAVEEVAAQFPTGSLTIVDRRFATSKQREFLREALELPPEIDLDDDRALREALADRSNGSSSR
jgi:hypothetical protein